MDQPQRIRILATPEAYEKAIATDYQDNNIMWAVSAAASILDGKIKYGERIHLNGSFECVTSEFFLMSRAPIFEGDSITVIISKEYLFFDTFAEALTTALPLPLV